MTCAPEPRLPFAEKEDHNLFTETVGSTLLSMCLQDIIIQSVA